MMNRTTIPFFACALSILTAGVFESTAAPTVQDDSGVAWEFGVGEDGNNYELNFSTVEGLGYEILTSNDLINWQRADLYRGLGADTRHPLFSALLPDNGSGDGSSGSTGVTPENYVQPDNVGIRYSRLVDGNSNDVGFHFTWVSVEDETTVKNYTVYGQTLHEFFPPTYVQILGEFYYSLGFAGSRTQVPVNDVLVGKDVRVVANFLDYLDQVNAEAAAYQQQVLTHQPLPADPEANKFFRIREITIDSDGDGWDDHLEIAYGTDYYNQDTDGDGIIDSSDAFPLINDAVADPDGAGLDTSLDNKLMARWDFEPTSGDSGLEDASGNGRNLAISGQTLANSFSPTGMVSYASNLTDGHFKRQAKFLKGDDNSIDLQDKMSVSLWMRLDKNMISNLSNNGSHVGIFNVGMSEYYTVQNNTGGSSAFVDYRTYGLNVKKNINGDELWAVGAYTYRNDHDAIPTSYVSQDPFSKAPTPSSSAGNEVQWIMPAGTSDGGDQWIHMVLVRHRDSNYADSTTSIYMNNQLVAEDVFMPWALENLGEWNDASCQLFLGQVYSDLSGQAPSSGQFKGDFDRVRIYDKVLNSNEVEQLYKQDIDRDGLWDVSEQKSLLWRDSNGDGIRTHDEDSYTANPFYHDPPNLDHDEDELTSFDEQNVHGTNIAHPDSDGDLLPDGWEVSFGLNPLDDTDAEADGDNDGVSNAREYRYASDPTLDDTDGDGTLDGVEITQGSLPGNGSDNGNPTSPEETFSIKLGVGDHSDSKSEDYVMNVFEIDEAGEEHRIYTLPSGGHGEYKEETQDFFNKNGMYSFKIQWKSSNLEPSGDINNPDGADFDYTFTVEPVYEGAEVALIDSIDPLLGQTEADSKILGENDDAAQFRNVEEKKRVYYAPIELDISMDSDMDGNIEALTPGRAKNVAPGQGGVLPFGNSADDENLEQTAGDAPNLMAAIIDINNNNTDSGLQSATSGQVDNENNVLDGKVDMDELTAGVGVTTGHSFGTMQIVMRYSRAVDPKYSPDSPYRLRATLVDQPGQAIGSRNVVRVFNHGEFSAADGGKPDVLLDAELYTNYIDLEKFYTDGQRGMATGALDKELSANSRRVFQKQLFVVEGLRAGYAVIEVELVKFDENFVETVIHKDYTTVVVNVDAHARATAEVATEKDAIALRGKAPHYMGFRNTPVHSSVRAIKGKIIARPPSRLDGVRWNTMSTWMTSNFLRKPLQESKKDSGSSFWIGLRDEDSNGDYSWIQCGLRWRQKEDSRTGTLPFAYIESGTLIQSFSSEAPIVRQNASFETIGANDAGQGSVATGTSALSNWQNEPLELEFILYKNPGAENRVIDETEEDVDVSDVSLNHWFVWFRDARTGKSATVPANYFGLKANWAAPNKTIGAAGRDLYRDAYKGQNMNLLEGQFETNQSISFAPGLAGAPAQIVELREATGLKAGITPSSRPNTPEARANFLWADASFDWGNTSVSADDVTRQFRTGYANAEETAIHEWWNVEYINGGITLWDTREWGFGLVPNSN